MSTCNGCFWFDDTDSYCMIKEATVEPNDDGCNRYTDKDAPESLLEDYDDDEEEEEDVEDDWDDDEYTGGYANDYLYAF